MQEGILYSPYKYVALLLISTQCLQIRQNGCVFDKSENNYKILPGTMKNFYCIMESLCYNKTIKMNNRNMDLQLGRNGEKPSQQPLL